MIIHAPEFKCIVSVQLGWHQRINFSYFKTSLNCEVDYERVISSDDNIHFVIRTGVGYHKILVLGCNVTGLHDIIMFVTCSFHGYVKETNLMSKSATSAPMHRQHNDQE